MPEVHEALPEQDAQLRAYVEQLLAECTRYAAALAQSHDLIARLIALEDEGSEPETGRRDAAAPFQKE